MPPDPRRARVALALSITLAAPLSAQRAAPATVPLAVARAAVRPLAQMFSGEALFSVSRAPEGWPGPLVPPTPARTVGGVSMGGVQIAVFAYRLPPDGARAAYDTVLLAAGWRKGVQPVRPGFGAPATKSDPTYCRGDESLSVDASDSTAASATIVVMKFAGRDGAFSPACREANHGVRRMSVGAGITLPQLVPPADTKLLGTSSGFGSGGESTTSATADGDRPPRALLAHFAPQLAAAGWTVHPPLGDDELAVQRLERATPEGDRWRGTLMAERVGPRQVVINLRVAKAAKP